MGMATYAHTGCTGLDVHRMRMVGGLRWQDLDDNFVEVALSAVWRGKIQNSINSVGNSTRRMFAFDSALLYSTLLY